MVHPCRRAPPLVARPVFAVDGPGAGQEGVGFAFAPAKDLFPFLVGGLDHPVPALDFHCPGALQFRGLAHRGPLHRLGQQPGRQILGRRPAEAVQIPLVQPGQGVVQGFQLDVIALAPAGHQAYPRKGSSGTSW